MKDKNNGAESKTTPIILVGLSVYQSKEHQEKKKKTVFGSKTFADKKSKGEYHTLIKDLN